ncbi:MAG: hypothetical protein V3V99_08425 [candidate division Zixibacteria bacterium]
MYYLLLSIQINQWAKIKTILVIVSIALLFSAYLIANDKPENENTISDAQQILKKTNKIFKSRKYEESRDIYMQALKAAEKSNNLSDQTEALSMIARTHLINDDINTGYIWLEKAKKTADFDEPLGWSRYMGVKGRFLWKEESLNENYITALSTRPTCSPSPAIWRLR